MNETVSYSNRKSPIQWFFFVLLSIFALLLLSLMIWADEGHVVILIPLVIVLTPLILITNKMFLAKIIIQDDYVEYKSPFKSARLTKDRIQAIDIIKKPKVGPVIYYSNDQKPDFNFGRYYLIIRSHYKPDSGNFLLFKPVKDDTYITAEYRSELLEQLSKFIK